VGGIVVNLALNDKKIVFIFLFHDYQRVVGAVDSNLNSLLQFVHIHLWRIIENRVLISIIHVYIATEYNQDSLTITII